MKKENKLKAFCVNPMLLGIASNIDRFAQFTTEFEKRVFFGLNKDSFEKAIPKINEKDFKSPIIFGTGGDILKKADDYFYYPEEKLNIKLYNK